MGKRKALTSDDLLRRQESSGFKRIKYSSATTYESSDDSQSDGESSISRQSVSVVQSGHDEDEDDSTSSEEDKVEESRLEVKERVAFGSRILPVAKVEKSESLKKFPSSFSELGISSPLQSALRMMSIHTPTEVQAACIPPLLNGARL